MNVMKLAKALVVLAPKVVRVATKIRQADNIMDAPEIIHEAKDLILEIDGALRKSK